MSLRDEIIKLAHDHPELRAQLLPLLERTAEANPSETDSAFKAWIQAHGLHPEKWDRQTENRYYEKYQWEQKHK